MAGQEKPTRGSGRGTHKGEYSLGYMTLANTNMDYHRLLGISL
jgi:hypothetical protein